MKVVILALMALVLTACTVPTRTVVFTPASVSPLQPPTTLATTDVVAFTPAVAVIETLPTVPIAPALNARAVTCLAETVYHEARSESVRGQLAVAHVVINRTENTKFPSTVCGVVYQGVRRHGRLVRHRCQFAWACNGRSDKPRETAAYAECVALATRVLQGHTVNPIGKSLYFHTAKRQRRAPGKLASRVLIGHHVFSEKYVRTQPRPRPLHKRVDVRLAVYVRNPTRRAGLD